MNEETKKPKRIGRPTKEMVELARKEKELDLFIRETYQKLKEQITVALNSGDLIASMSDVNQGLDALEKLHRLSDKKLNEKKDPEEKTLSINIEGDPTEIEEEIKKEESVDSSLPAKDADQDFLVIE